MKKTLVFLVLTALLLISATALADMPAVESSMPLQYARNFTLDYLEGGYTLITISDGSRFLTIPEGMEAPDNLDEDVTLLWLPLDNLLISSTSTISLIDAIGRLDAVGQTTTDADSWYIDAVREALSTGRMRYIGSYKEPDFEVLAAEQPPLAVFSTMLLSAPDVAEKLAELGIPVLLDQSTYEEHPLARVEWVKLYGELLGRQAEAQAVFEAQAALVDGLQAAAAEKTVAMFYIISNGGLYARNGGDYMAKMLELAGGSYVPAGLNPEKSGTQKLEMEEFYAQAGDADYIIYIWSTGGKPATMAELLERNAMLSEFRAVKEGNVWCTTPDYFQISDSLGEMIADMNRMLTNDDPGVDAFTYLFRLQ